MQVTSGKAGNYYEGIFNQEWNTMALTWFDASDSLDSDRLANTKQFLEEVPVDKYGYVWDGTDHVEDSNTNLANAAHGMGWPFPNALHTDQKARFWDFNDTFDNSKTSKQENGSTWSSNISASAVNGIYQGTADSLSGITFEVKDYAIWSSYEDPIIHTEYAPWLAIDIRMNTADYDKIDDIYVWYTTSRSQSYTDTQCVKVSEIAPLSYGFTRNYEHVLYLPMYAQNNWNSVGNGDVYKLKIEIRAKEGSTLSGEFGLNYVRPSFDTRHSNNNSNYISSLKQYYSFTGDLEFLQQNIVKARKAMNFYMQMYDEERHLIRQSYLFGHDGDRNEIYKGLGNGYWDVLYTPDYDFQSNMYFYKALEDLIYMEEVLAENSITVNPSDSTIMTAETDFTRSTSAYSYDKESLRAVAADVLSALRSSTDDTAKTGFYSPKTGRFIAGYDNEGKQADYGYVIWNLEAVCLGIADEAQSRSIMQWISGEREISGDASTGADLYYYQLAPRTTTVNDNTIYGSFCKTSNTVIYNGTYGNTSVQFGGAAMYTSYYDLMSRLKVCGADNAFTRLKGIQEWYDHVYDYYKNENTSAKAIDFYWDYYRSRGIMPQNGSKAECTNGGVIGIDGEFTESLLMAAAVPYGFFGIRSDNGKCLSLSPALPKSLGYWKIENLAFNQVKYDVTIYEKAVRIDSVRGNTEGVSIKIALDYQEGEAVYINGEKTTDYKAEGGKAIVSIPFADAIVEIR